MRNTRLPLLLLVLSLGACAAHPATQSGHIGRHTLNVADAALVAGNPALALRVAQVILRRDPHNAAALVREGDALYALHQIAAAEASYRAALAAAPHDAGAEIGLGRCLLFSDPAAAALRFRAAIADQPGNARAFNDLGIARDLGLHHKRAQLAYRQALAAQPGYVAAEINLGLSLALSGDSAGALALLRPVADLPGAAPRMREDLAAALTLAGHPAEARQVLAGLMPPEQITAALAGYAALGPTPAPAPALAPMPTPAPAAAALPDLPVKPVSFARPAPPPAPPAPVSVPVPAVPGLRVAATADSWVSFTSPDGTLVKGRLLHAGDSVAVPAGGPFLFTTGNAGATELMIDGAASPPLGAPGMVRRALFDPALIHAKGIAALAPWPVS